MSGQNTCNKNALRERRTSTNAAKFSTAYVPKQLTLSFECLLFNELMSQFFVTSVFILDIHKCDS